MRTKIKKIIIKIGYLVFKVIRSPIKWYWKRFNIQTQGVRIMAVYNQQLILVRHWYNPLWVMPGGGIKKHETPEQSATRELREEIGIQVDQFDYKLGSYSNNKEGKNDTVHCFVIDLKEKPIINKKRFNIEVSDIIWGSMQDLPESTSIATRTRIAEYLSGDIDDALRLWSH